MMENTTIGNLVSLARDHEFTIEWTFIVSCTPDVIIDAGDLDWWADDESGWRVMDALTDCLLEKFGDDFSKGEGKLVVESDKLGVKLSPPYRKTLWFLEYGDNDLRHVVHPPPSIEIRDLDDVRKAVLTETLTVEWECGRGSEHVVVRSKLETPLELEQTIIERVKTVLTLPTATEQERVHGRGTLVNIGGALKLTYASTSETSQSDVAPNRVSGLVALF